ncbi:MAG: amidoligase family protein [Bacillota bacterium]
MSNLSRKKIIKVIEKLFEYDEQNTFTENRNNFLVNFLKPHMEIEFEYLDEKENGIKKEVGIIEEIVEYYEDNEQRDFVRCYEKNGNTLFDVPIFEIDKNIFNQIIEEYLSEKEKEKILYPERRIKRKFKDINMKSSCNFAFEIEGAFNEKGIDKEIDEYDLEFNYDSSVNVEEAEYWEEYEEELVYKGFLPNDEMLDKTFSIMNLLDEYQFIHNKTCGIHIHVSENLDNIEDSWKIQDLYKLSQLYTNIEEIFYCFVPESRHNDYHRANKLNEENVTFFNAIKNLPPQVIDGMDYMDEQTIERQFGNTWYHSVNFDDHTDQRRQNSRYVGFNAHSYFYRGSIEFRHFDSNYNLLPCWLDLLDKMVYTIQNKSASQIHLVCRKINELENLEDKIINFLNLMGVSNMTMDILAKRTVELHPNKIDEELINHCIEEILEKRYAQEYNPFLEFFDDEEDNEENSWASTLETDSTSDSNSTVSDFTFNY